MEKDFTVDDIISVMKKTRKTDPLFKPLKKLKTAIEVSLALGRASDLKISLLFRPKECWFFISVWGMNSIGSSCCRPTLSI